MRADHKVILNIVDEGSKVLDLGCGDGVLIQLLNDQKKCKASGIEIDDDSIYDSLSKGLSVSHGDIDSGLPEYGTQRFDYVILNESLQEVMLPKNVIIEALRVGKKVIVGIPNLCHFGSRVQIFFNGRAPITTELPYQWYDTPNIRFLSLKDFRDFCRENNIKILKEVGLNKNKIVKFKKNLFAHTGIYLLEKG